MDNPEGSAFRAEKEQFDVESQVEHWRAGAYDSWDTAGMLLEDRRVEFGLFCVHLALEKLLKALVWRTKQAPPPRIHNLVRLAELAGLPLNDAHREVLSEVNDFNIEGRYSDITTTPPTYQEAGEYFRRAKGTFEWLKTQF